MSYVKNLHITDDEDGPFPLRVWWVNTINNDVNHVYVPHVRAGVAVLSAFETDSAIDPELATSSAGGLESFADGQWCEWCHVKDEIEVDVDNILNDTLVLLDQTPPNTPVQYTELAEGYALRDAIFIESDGGLEVRLLVGDEEITVPYGTLYLGATFYDA